MVGSGSSPRKPETGGSVDGFEHEKPIFNRPDRKTHQNFSSPPIGVGSWPHFVRSVEIRWDLVEIWPDLVEIRRDLTQSLQLTLRIGLISLRSRQISLRSGLISLRSAKISLRSGQIQQKPEILAKSGDDFCKIRRWFTQFETDRYPTGNWWHPTTRSATFGESATGPGLGDPKWSGRFQVGHKPDPWTGLVKSDYMTWHVGGVWKCV